MVYSTAMSGDAEEAQATTAGGGVSGKKSGTGRVTMSPPLFFFFFFLLTRVASRSGSFDIWYFDVRYFFFFRPASHHCKHSCLVLHTIEAIYFSWISWFWRNTQIIFGGLLLLSKLPTANFGISSIIKLSWDLVLGRLSITSSVEHRALGYCNKG